MKILLIIIQIKYFFADANSTIRLTYGKIEGSNPKDGIGYNWFTTIDGIIEKYNTGSLDYEIPEKLMTLYDQKIMENMVPMEL